MNLTQTQLEAKQAFLNRQQEYYAYYLQKRRHNRKKCDYQAYRFVS